MKIVNKSSFENGVPHGVNEYMAPPRVISAFYTILSFASYEGNKFGTFSWVTLVFHTILLQICWIANAVSFIKQFFSIAWLKSKPIYNKCRKMHLLCCIRLKTCEQIWLKNSLKVFLKKTSRNLKKLSEKIASLQGFCLNIFQT